MKLRATKSELAAPVEGTRSAIIPDTLDGDYIGIARGKNLLSVKLSDLVAFLDEQEKVEQAETSSCPA